MYAIGADAVLTEQWSLPTAGDPDDFFSLFGGGDEDSRPPEPLVFEPPFYVHEDLPGVKAAARVFDAQCQHPGRRKLQGSGTDDGYSPP